jgi:hypothetical protein
VWLERVEEEGGSAGMVEAALRLPAGERSLTVPEAAD